MKKFVRITAIFSAVLVIAALLTAFSAFSKVSAASTPTLTVTQSKENVHPGDTFTLTVSISNNPGLLFLTFGFKIDTSVFEAVSAENLSSGFSDRMSGNHWSTSDKAVKFVLEPKDLENGSSENGKIASVTLKAKSDAKFGDYSAGLFVDSGNTFDKSQQSVKFSLSCPDIKVNCIHHDDTSVIKTEGYVAATCETAGKTGDKICTKCGETTEYSASIPALGHDKQTVNAKVPTCEKEGYSGDVECRRCGKTLEKGHTVAKTPHTASSKRKDAKAATCTKEGYTGDVVCSVCGTVMTKGTTIPKTAHTAASKRSGVKDATCTKEGYTGDVVCSVCGTVMEKGKATPVDANKHNTTVTNKKAATCGAEGYTGDTVCRDCGKTIKTGTVIPADENAHVPGEPANKKDATCGADGYTGDITCTVCGKVIEQGTVIPADADKHVPGEPTGKKDATCKAEGYTGDITCTVCGKVIERGKAIPKTEHKTETRGEKAASCHEEGYTGDLVCTVCGQTVKKGEAIAKTEHTFRGGKCTVCGEIDPDYVQQTDGGIGPVIALAVSVLIFIAAAVALGFFIWKKRRS